MNYENNEMLTSPNLSYTSRDYNTIYNELMKSIPLLTKSWNPTDENDPGVVIIKLLSMLGDMLSYNLDKAALEAFPRTVLLRSNAQQIFRLIGYKMHWWRSARIEASFTNANTFPIYIDRYNVFSTSDANISYTNTSDIIIPSGTYGDAPYIVELIQGTPVTPVKRNYDSATTKNWYDMYDYNVQSDEIINNKLYLKYSNIDETSITIIDNDETPFASNEWTQVENINLSETMDKVFEFDVDENNIPFIQFPNYWQEKYVITKFKVFLVLSNGKNGEIEENTLTRIGIEKCHTNNETVSIGEALELVEVFNIINEIRNSKKISNEIKRVLTKNNIVISNGNVNFICRGILNERTRLEYELLYFKEYYPLEYYYVLLKDCPFDDIIAIIRNGYEETKNRINDYPKYRYEHKYLKLVTELYESNISFVIEDRFIVTLN